MGHLRRVYNVSHIAHSRFLDAIQKHQDDMRTKTIRNRQKKMKLIQATFAALLQFIPDDLHPVLNDHEVDEKFPYRRLLIFWDNPYLNLVMEELISFPSRYRSLARRQQLALWICGHFNKDPVLPERICSVDYYKALFWYYRLEKDVRWSYNQRLVLILIIERVLKVRI